MWALSSAETTVALHSREWLWAGIYMLEVEIADEQGLTCPEKQEFELEVCTCVEQLCEPKTEESIAESTSMQVAGPLLGPVISVMFLILCE